MPIQTKIGDVTRTLTALLKEGQDTRFFEVTSESPADFEEGADGTPRVNLFLFHLEPNPMGNGPNWQVISPERRRKAGLALHLYYLMNAIASARADEHRALGTAMGIFHDSVEIEPERLKGALAHEAESLRLDLCAYSIEDQTRIWSALGSAYRLGVFYRVRLVTLDSGIEIVTPRGSDIQTRLGKSSNLKEFGS